MKDIVKKTGKKIMESITKLSPMISCKLLFLMRTHSLPNLKEPKTFNEKTTWLKLNSYKDNPLAIQCADKYKVREYIKKRGCAEILNELYGVYENFSDIDFSKLPNQFALKCTHGCAYNIICTDKNNFDYKEAQKKVNHWLNEKYGYATTELHYTKIKPQIIIEKYLCDKENKMPLDYKFYCFNGEAKAILVCSEREEKLRLNYFDTNWQPKEYGKSSWRSAKKIEKPENLDKMIQYAEKISKEFPFVRVDLYNDHGKIIFGEMTFTPACCCAPYYSEQGNHELGKMLNLR